MEPRRIGGYELRDVLGEGGMGTVYRAHDPTLERLAAVKVIVEEAGGRFTDRHGVATHEHDSAISSNGLLHAVAVERLGR